MPSLLMDWIDAGKHNLEGQIARGNDTIAPAIHCRRGGELIAMILGQYPRFVAAQIAPRAVAGFGADELVFISDTYYAMSMTNPEGKVWTHGEMDRRFKDPATKGMISESMLACRVQESAISGVMAKYHRSGKHVIWDGKPEEVGNAMGGDIPDMLQHALRQPHLGPLVKPFGDAAGLNADEQLVHIRCATVRGLMEVAEKMHERVSIAIALPKTRPARNAFQRSMRDNPDIRFEAL